MRYSANLNVIIKAIEKATIHTPRDFNELENLQSNPALADKFAVACYNRIKQILVQDFSKFRPDYNLIFSDGQQIIKKQDAEYSYVIFPIDGFENLTRSNPDFTVAVALEHLDENGQRQAISVAISKIIGNELYYCEKGFGAYLNNRRLRVSKRANCKFPLMVTEDQLLLSKKISSTSFAIRYYGCRTLELAYLASARFEGALFQKQNCELLKPFLLLVKEAGGIIIEDEKFILIYNAPIQPDQNFLFRQE
jgi:myo-inositol-1(or 4)-monophosphatase